MTDDGRLHYEHSQSQYNYTLINGRGYVTVESMPTREIKAHECLKNHDLPPLHELPRALSEARVVDDASPFGLSTDACPQNARLAEVRFAGESYVLCYRDDADIFAVHGSNVRATLRAVNESPDDVTLDSLRIRPSGESVDTCETLLNKYRVAPIANARSSAARMVGRMKDAALFLSGRRRLADNNDCSRACKDGKKVCLLVHGLGQLPPKDERLSDSYESMWGDAQDNLNCCTKTKFLRFDTINNAWHSDVLSEQLCDAAMELSNSEDPMNLDNIAILSHSMGNLVVANAAMTERCVIGKTSKWIALAGPIKGSHAANLGVEVCSKNETVVDTTVRQILSLINVCPARNATRSLVYRDSDMADRDLDQLYAQAEKTFAQYVTSSMCGVSASGLSSLHSVWYSTLGALAGHKSANDGAVEIESCRGPFPETKYSTSWRGGHFYKAAINHADATMRHGDGLWGDNRKPVKWVNCQF